MDLGLAGRVFIVAGGSLGPGRAVAEALVNNDARVVVSARSSSALNETVASLGGANRAVSCECDISDDEAPSSLIDAFSRLDGALISSGGPPPGSETKLTDAQWQEAFGPTFLGPLRMARTLVDQLDDGGSIAIVLSSSVRSPIAGLGLSNGFRPGLAMAAKALADEAGPRGIRVNGLVSGRIRTERLVQVEAATSTADSSDRIPLRRYGDPRRVRAHRSIPAIASGLLHHRCHDPGRCGAMRFL